MADEKKPIPLSPGDRTNSIPLGGNTLARMFGSAEQPNPDAQGKLNAMLSISGHVDRTFIPARSVLPVKSVDTGGLGTRKPSIYARGDTAYDVVHERKVTIMKANVAFSPKGTPFYRVSDRNGNVWVQSERKLQPRTPK